MIRYLLGTLGIENVGELALTATEAAVAAMLLRLLIFPLLRRASFWEILPKSLQLFLVAVVASAGAALDHFAAGNNWESSALTGTMAFLGALGLEKSEAAMRRQS
jgi:hypothetical protein